MDHGVTSAHVKEISKRAGHVESESVRSIAHVRHMIEDYEHELESYKARIAKMEAAEVDRLTKEIAYREELAANHGKPKSFWRVPVFNTQKRRNERRESALLLEQSTP
mmetsp:Transcript_7335/g.10371  ORF Transcript_7335/g.10371 Transcript_7335/m.10371 type:complete len:108 (-) Transcript_7335:980-1303(-)|eukprot:CAMPEP_0185570468 /NCGR_PEP_ID=MMETSP0434-20130131/2765_1 /TAXON_ID=626734 ORGANISM="Favella taraikaensis, Strain Fe Narragansett Bay" /NCGR_SAMPLE_ID=MMETSP0434 /ASSEMBLY_ACC=CAM_ASM_000379 /LENGTH=107 /DNA_ID=CAMNT_0028185605 /DNA_START=606 /DNA_END=929 /DNA_ORIENTATION=-